MLSGASILGGIAGAAAMAFIIWMIMPEKEHNCEPMYHRGELFIGWKKDDNSFFVYCPNEEYAVLFEGTIQECQEWIANHTIDEQVR